ncbi:hypothetical protein ACHAXA_005070, partial [Cyclostephanos tholiformis]
GRVCFFPRVVIVIPLSYAAVSPYRIHVYISFPFTRASIPSILHISCLTKKDREDLNYMLGIGVDWVALSFVQRPEDIVEIKRLIMEYNPTNAFTPHVMAKIEKPSCFVGDSLEKIVQLSDGIMVARGDLGVECAPEDVPILQKTIIDKCRKQGKPVVVATQMLESMIDNPTPTRAEASDAATAIYDGADAIMFSAESAAGMYPEEAVLMQQRIINRVEGDPHYSLYLTSNRPKITDGTSASAIILAARQIATNVNAKCIASFTVGGNTARLASMKRPEQPILAISPLIKTCRHLAMSWGVYPEYCAEGVLDTDNFRSMLAVACEIGLKKGLVSNDTDLLVVTALEEPDHEAKRLLGDDGLHEDVVVPVRGPPPRPRGDSIAGIGNRHHLRPGRRQVFLHRDSDNDSRITSLAFYSFVRGRHVTGPANDGRGGALGRGRRERYL